MCSACMMGDSHCRLEALLLFHRSNRRFSITDRFDRQRMIAETSAFLEWALSDGQGLPRIPRRRVDEGGFTMMMRRPLGRIIAAHWWRRALERIDF